MNIGRRNLKEILIKAESGGPLAMQDIGNLLAIEDTELLHLLFETSRKLRLRNFGEKIFLYGFIYTSTFCRNDCSFCFFRRSNVHSTRYRKDMQSIVTAAAELAESGVHLIDLTMGEDPALFNDQGGGFEQLLSMVSAVRKKTSLPIMISPGVMTAVQLKMLADAGATWYACYQETHNRKLFMELRPGQDFDIRMTAKFDAHAHGLLIEEGVLCGVGERFKDLAQSLMAMQELRADQIRAMTFIPQQGTPMAARSSAGAHRETLLIAIMRLVFPEALIPASLDLDGVHGLNQRLDAGANVVTSIVPPGSGLAGVARPSLGIEEGLRTVTEVKKVLKACGLEAATPAEYKHWISGRQQFSNQGSPQKYSA